MQWLTPQSSLEPYIGMLGHFRWASDLALVSDGVLADDNIPCGRQANARWSAEAMARWAGDMMRPRPGLGSGCWIIVRDGQVVLHEGTGSGPLVSLRPNQGLAFCDVQSFT